MAARANPNPSRNAEYAEEMDFLLEQHQGVAYIIQTLGKPTPGALVRRLERAGRRDLAKVIRTQSTIPLLEREPA